MRGGWGNLRVLKFRAFEVALASFLGSFFAVRFLSDLASLSISFRLDVHFFQ